MNYPNKTISLKISSLNIQGIRKYSDSAVFKEYCKQYDIIALYETWQEGEADLKKNIDGYENFDSMRKKKSPASRAGVRGAKASCV